jgi:hypothetical protein
VNDVTTQIDRVVANTDPRINAQIQRRAEERVGWLEKHQERIPERLAELDREWDVERWLETMSAGVSLVGLGLALRGKRRGLVLPLAVQGFFLQHAIQGWCPPLPVLRKMGVRTQREIDEERYALLDILRDSGDMPQRTQVHDKPRTARTGASAS